MSTVMFLSHGSAIGTNLHCGVMDARAVRADGIYWTRPRARSRTEKSFMHLQAVIGTILQGDGPKIYAKIDGGGVPSEARLAHARLSE